MTLTTAQLQALKADIAADPVLAAKPLNSDGAFDIAAAYNLIASPAFPVWATNASVAAVYDAIDWDKFTPIDAPDNTATYTNRLLAIQTKQMNLQNMLTGRDRIDASKARTRVGLRDAVIQLPAGAGGAMVTAGGTSGANVLNALTRNATRAEKLLATPNVTTGTVTAGILNFEGSLSYQDIEAARAS